MDRPIALQISQVGEEFEVAYLDASGEGMTYTFHQTLDQAFQQAESEFRVARSEWTILPAERV